MTYEELDVTAKEMGESNDCSVKATAVLADIDYRTAHALLKKLGRVFRKGDHPRNALRELGFQFSIVRFKSKTIRTLERELASAWGGIKILIYTKNQRHVLAWDGSMIQDWSAGRQQRVGSCYIVYPVGEYQPFPGKSVPVPERKELRGRKGHIQSAVLVSCDELDIQNHEYPSVAAAYKALGLSLRGHQKARRIMKLYGSVHAQARDALDPWKYVWLDIVKIE